MEENFFVIKKKQKWKRGVASIIFQVRESLFIVEKKQKENKKRNKSSFNNNFLRERKFFYNKGETKKETKA